MQRQDDEERGPGNSKSLGGSRGEAFRALQNPEISNLCLLNVCFHSSEQGRPCLQDGSYIGNFLDL